MALTIVLLLSDTVLDVHYDGRCNRLVCEAIELLGVTFKSTPYKRNDCLKWRELKFKPYFDSSISVSNKIGKTLVLILALKFQNLIFSFDRIRFRFGELSSCGCFEFTDIINAFYVSGYAEFF